MIRKRLAAVLALALAALPFPAWSQVGRIALEAPLAPAPSASAGAIGGSFSPTLSPAALTPALGLTPSLAAASPEPLIAAPVAAAVQPRRAVAITPVAAAPAVLPADTVRRPASNDDRHLALVESLQAVVAAIKVQPSDVGRLYDAPPAAPDLDGLTTVKTPEAPAPWTPSSALLKPAAGAVNAWRLSRHQKRLSRRMPEERLTTEEMGMRQSLTEAHAAISEGRLQDALADLTRLFKGGSVNGWYRRNERYRPYQENGHSYIRFIERAVKLAYERAHGRARDAALIAEARAAARAGPCSATSTAPPRSRRRTRRTARTTLCSTRSRRRSASPTRSRCTASSRRRARCSTSAPSGSRERAATRSPTSSAASASRSASTSERAWAPR
ncbi:MAG: hypothetical protein M0D55_02310 [Elusimicrobiota bacterium]|nr:MAG: hypothetical protein M0D55_02310 [Elusimicrobiota bacterium]